MGAAGLVMGRGGWTNPFRESADGGYVYGAQLPGAHVGFPLPSFKRRV
jgi:hypothetical protein